ncbi:MAG: mismatch-specific DNA-glycosylase [Gammaproteobacteria bacterium]
MVRRTAGEVETLPDFIAPGLRALVVGINPSLHAARAGYPFAFRQNRFWPALNASRLVDEPLEPGVAATRRLLEHYRIGFTDVVKRPTPGSRDLRAADFARDAPLLAAKVERAAPQMLWFHGKLAAREFCRRLLPGAAEVGDWGEQAFRFAGARCFVSPNPSPANARYRLADFVASYDALAALIEPV